MSQFPENKKNIINDSKVDVQGNFYQGDYHGGNVFQIISAGNTSEVYTGTNESFKLRYEKHKESIIVTRILSLNIEALAEEFFIHIRNQIETFEHHNKEHEFEEPLLGWIKKIFYEADDSVKPSLTSTLKKPHNIYNRKRLIIDVEEFLYFNKKIHDEFRKDLIFLEINQT